MGLFASLSVMVGLDAWLQKPAWALVPENVESKRQQQYASFSRRTPCGPRYLALLLGLWKMTGCEPPPLAHQIPRAKPLT